jgi:hypothetical protein
MNKTYQVRINKINQKINQSTHTYDMYDAMSLHWKYCGGDSPLYNQPFPYLWRGDDHTMAQFKLTQPDDNIIVEFIEVT